MALKSKLSEVKAKLSDAARVGKNTDYWVAGSEKLALLLHVTMADLFT
ncbi:hypothetical protein MRX60_13530 (plasmid) [Xylella fastidiosa subsp. pauca]|nr:hypothetical protein [Xylella fastidiosa]MDG5827037.1 hypothetical protein [Xylella fastidiosa subsp. pauca]